MSDVRLIMTPDGGEITITNGQFEIDSGLEGAVILSLWGGNDDDSGMKIDDSKQYWANLSEPDKSRVYRSETQNLLRSIPATPANLIRIEDAAGRDLAWMVDQLKATIEVSATMPGHNRINIGISIEIDGKKTPFKFSAPWKQAQ